MITKAAIEARVNAIRRMSVFTDEAPYCRRMLLGSARRLRPRTGKRRHDRMTEGDHRVWH
jgi:hypothetical protein